MREGGLPLPLAFHYLILRIRRACDLNLVMISSLASKRQDFILKGLQFHIIKCHFEVSEDIMTKLKSQALYIIRIKY